MKKQIESSLLITGEQDGRLEFCIDCHEMLSFIMSKDKTIRLLYCRQRKCTRYGLLTFIVEKEEKN